MNRSKRLGVLLVSVLLLWAGLCQIGPQVPLAGERPDAKPGNRQAKASPPAGAVDLRCQMEQPVMILSVVPPGKSVNKGDLLVELDASALMDKRMQQVFQTNKTETDWILARELQHWEKQAASGQIELAQKALRLAQGQLRAFTEGEYPHQLALAEGAAALADEKRKMLEDRVAYLRHAAKTQKEETAQTSLQEAELALQEAKLQSYAATGSLTLLKNFVHDNKVAELELVVAQREFDLMRAKDALSAATAKGGAIVQLAETTHQMVASQLAKLDDQIMKSKTYAPQDGIVAYPDDAGEAAIRPGAVVRPNQTLVRLLPATPTLVKP